MFEISATHPRLPALFDVNVPNSPILFSVLRGENPGRAFADDEANPSQAAVRTNDALVFLSQGAPQAFLDETLTHLGQFGQVGLIWRPSRALPRPPQAPEIIPRREFTIGGANSQTLAALESRLPKGYELRQIDRGLLERCEWKSTIESGCGSLDNFLVYGLGICLMRGNDIITEVYAPFWGLDQVEISVVTNQAYRRRGYATTACAQLIRLCRERGFEPYWSCEAFNIAALNLAARLGFRGERDYEIRLYRDASA